jgi:hypothetical protein
LSIELHRHPLSEGGESLILRAEASSPQPGRLRLRYSLTGDLSRLRVPPPASPERADELWRRTCFEAFLGTGEGAYHEFNFAPSGRWAAYRLDGYRAGLAPAPMLEAPAIGMRRSADRLDLEADLALPDVASNARLGLSAVLEDEDGRISYWALAHPPGKPDFHHPDSFVLELPGPS